MKKDRLPYSEAYYDTEQPFDPCVYDGSMSPEDYVMMWDMIEADECEQRWRRQIKVSITNGLKVIVSALAAWLVSLWAIPYAAEWRGYGGAIGGEGLLIGAVFFGTMYGLVLLGRAKARRT